MSLNDYVQKLQMTNMFREKLISISEYNYKSLFGALLKPPPLPVADQNTHYVILKMSGGQPAFAGIMTSNRKTYQPTSRDNGHLLFVAIDVKRRNLAIANSESGFLLQDSHAIYANMEVEYRVNDVERFWSISDEPLDVLKLRINNAAADFFLNINSIDLIRNSYDIKQGLEYTIQDSDLKLTKAGLEQNIKGVNLEGISILNVYATINLSPQLKEYIDLQHRKLYAADGKMDRASSREMNRSERQHIDKLIEQDWTFEGWGLRQIIMAINAELLNNFYVEPWNDAMQKVLQAVEERKRGMMKSQQDMNFELLKKQLRQAKELGLDEDYMDEIKGKIAEQFLTQIEEDENSNEDNIPSNEALFKKLIGPPSKLIRQIDGSVYDQIGLEDSDN